MKYQLILLLALSCFYANSEARKLPAREAATYESKRAIGDPLPSETPDALLMRLKLLAYTEKLKAKEAKKKLKADKKAAKDAAFASYLTSFLPAAAPAPGAATPLSPLAAALAPATTAAAAPAPAPVPIFPGLGLFKKTFLLSQMMAAAAAAQASLATTTTTPVPILETTVAPNTDASDEEDDDTAAINEIVKRYAPVLRKKFFGSENPSKYQNKDDEETYSEEEDSETPNYKSGSYNKFGTGPAGSPTGVGHEQGKVNQAGCSGNHIHICSGTTVYLTNPDDESVQELALAGEELGDQLEGNDEDTVTETDDEEEQQDSNDSDEQTKEHKKKHKHGRDH